METNTLATPELRKAMDTLGALIGNWMESLPAQSAKHATVDLITDAFTKGGRLGVTFYPLTNEFIFQMRHEHNEIRELESISFKMIATH